MTPTSDRAHNGNNGANSSTEIAHLEQRGREVAAKLRTVFALLSEIETNYPELWDFVHKIVQDELDPRNKIPEGMDLETWAQQQGAQPLETFLHEFEQLP